MGCKRPHLRGVAGVATNDTIADASVAPLCRGTLRTRYYNILALPCDDVTIKTAVDGIPVERSPFNSSAATFCQGEAKGSPVQGLGVPPDRTAQPDNESILRTYTVPVKTEWRQMKNRRARELQKWQKGEPVRLRKGVGETFGQECASAVHLVDISTTPSLQTGKRHLKLLDEMVVAKAEFL